MIIKNNLIPYGVPAADSILIYKYTLEAVYLSYTNNKIARLISSGLLYHYNL